jgi:periplasmic divalent cation tolerance protein
LEGDGEIVVFVTAGSQEEGAKIGRAVVEAGLAACANIVPGVRSIFRWEGKISEEGEVLILLKSRAVLFDALAATIKRHHSYSVPEIIALPILLGAPDYLAWLRQVTEAKNC